MSRVHLKVTIKTAKVIVIVALVVLCYEAAMQVKYTFGCLSRTFGTFSSSQGSEANWENVSASTKEDLIALGNLLMTKSKEVAVGIMKKYNL